MTTCALPARSVEQLPSLDLSNCNFINTRRFFRTRVETLSSQAVLVLDRRKTPTMTLVSESAIPASPDQWTSFRGTMRPSFTTVEEADCAALLDAHGIGWEHAPIEFDLASECASTGDEATTFRPCFYLPDLNVFLATNSPRQLMQRLISRHPDVDVRSFHPRDLDVLQTQQRSHDQWATLTRTLLAV